MEWAKFFTDRARRESKEYRKVGWNSIESMYAKFSPLLNLINFDNVLDFLDVGSGTGALAAEVAQRYPDVTIKGVDITKNLIDFANEKSIKNATFLFGNINKLPFDDKSFDLVSCIGVLQNFNGTLDTALDELCRCVRDNGCLYIVTLDDESEVFKEGTRSRDDREHYFVPDDIAKTIMSKGFWIKQMGSISLNGTKPLHKTHTFFLIAEQQREK